MKEEGKRVKRKEPARKKNIKDKKITKSTQKEVKQKEKVTKHTDSKENKELKKEIVNNKDEKKEMIAEKSGEERGNTIKEKIGDRKVEIVERETEKQSESGETSNNKTLKNSKKAGNKEKNKIKFLLIPILIAILLIFSVIFAIINIGNEKILGKVSIMGIDVSNMTREEAKETLSQLIENKLTEEIILKKDDYETSLNANQLDANFDLDTAVKEEMAIYDLLLDKGYEVHGIVQSYSQLASASLKKYINNEQIINKYLFFHVGDITDTSSVSKIIEDIRPDEMYHLASQTHVDLSFEIPEYTAQVNALGTLRILEAIKRSETRIKLFNLSTCQLFSGDIYPQNEETVFDPKSPYAISKLYAHYMIKSYRENYNLFAVNGICYNHDSPRKEDYFLSRKVCEHLKNNPYKVLKLGNLNPIREWGHAKDYAEAMWLMLQQDTPNDFIVATGEALSVRDFVTLAYKMAGITLNWQGEGLDEIATDAKTGQKLIEVDSNLIRPNDAKCLVGDATKIKKMIGWQPKHSVKDLIIEMLED